ncbi:GNAT family N-acetyltransferase [Janthinobacterium fluminis]|uniref:GNAT family N-acetyltransferase n=1 Tax=Janthinobacterium fluminis TaxID=2987524 RepID=A0ABT5K1J5_9BURK|nr:GNAT family N-acetyltransferase [Janthinobacterium fluminis]MDC8758857.1 GNAT family N-acetyltransferase [Janthinobacterium fluminis]
MSAAPTLRLAETVDVARLEALIAHSGIALSAGFYTPQQAEAVTSHVFGVDSQLIADRSYFLIEQDGVLLACGGWSRRRTLFGGDRAKSGPDPLLDPASEAARIRAFFVAPEMARRGLGRQLLQHCKEQALLAGFRTLELAATMPGVPLYLAAGFEVVDSIELHLPGGIIVPLARMRQAIGPA